MEREPTGLPDLDGLIERGIPRPFCLSICGDMSSLKQVLAWHIIAGLLRNGCSGLYVCLDFPAAEIRIKLNRLAPDTEASEKKGDLVFLDFFSARAEKTKAGEAAELSDLAYDPNEIMREIIQHLPKMGRKPFIILDTVSTLLMGTDAKRAYELIRGIKMLTRTHDVIAIGISHTDPIDPRELEMMRSNADGCIRLQQQELWIERFDRTNFVHDKVEMEASGTGVLLIRRGEKRAKDIAELIRKDLDSLPSVVDSSDISTRYAVDNTLAEQVLLELSEEGALKRAPDRKRLSCPKCSSLTVYSQGKCPKCGSLEFMPTPLIEHYSCGCVRPEREYANNRCPKCGKEIKSIGVDHSKTENRYTCQNCNEIFQEPIVQYVCARCRERFQPFEARWVDTHSYSKSK